MSRSSHVPSMHESDRYLLTEFPEIINAQLTASVKARKVLNSQMSKYACILRKKFYQHILKNRIRGIYRVKSDNNPRRIGSYNQVNNVSTINLPTQPAHVVYWAHKQEIGYKYNSQKEKEPIHDDLEDVLKITCEDFTYVNKHDLIAKPNSPPIQIYTRNTLGTSTNSKMFLFVMADGHGGSDAAKFFVNKTQEAITLLVESRRWDLSFHRDREIFEREVVNIFNTLDDNFVKMKIDSFKNAAASASKNSTDCIVDNSNTIFKPKDDGCTLVVNIIYQNYLININTGDSRTILATKKLVPNTSTSNNFRCMFSSKDHNMAHAEKIAHAHRMGGKFISRDGTMTELICSKPPSVPLVINNTPPPDNISSKDASDGDKRVSTDSYKKLGNGFGLRLYRPFTKQLRELNFSCNRTLNLSAAMGDVLFKVDPCIVSCSPDVKFVRLSSYREYLIIAATDGVWDHIDTTRDERFSKKESLREVYDSDEYHEVQTDLMLKLCSNIIYSSTSCSCGKTISDEVSVKIDNNSGINGVSGNTISDNAGNSDIDHGNKLNPVSPTSPSHVYPPPFLNCQAPVSEKLRQHRKDRATRLKKLVSILVSREPTESHCSCIDNFFHKNLSRYDDSTCIAILLEPSAESESQQV